MELKTLEYFFQVFAMFPTQIFLCTQYILQESEILKNKIFERDYGENMLVKKREKNNFKIRQELVISSHSSIAIVFDQFFRNPFLSF